MCQPGDRHVGQDSPVITADYYQALAVVREYGGCELHGVSVEYVGEGTAWFCVWLCGFLCSST
jgi:hypothetical protein